MLSIGIQFNSSSIIPADAPSNSVIGIVGTAAIGPVNVPKIIRNQQEAIATFGYQTTGSTIPDALARAYASYGQIPFVVVNVAANPPQIAVVAAEFKFDNQDRIQLPHKHITVPVVTNQAGSTTYVFDTDYGADLTKGIIQRKGSTIPADAIVKIGYSRPDFSGITPAQIVGGINGTTGKREGLEALIDAELVDLKPSNITDIICPNYSQIASVATKMAEIGGKLRAQYYLDATASSTLAQVLDGRTSGASPNAHLATRNELAVLCYPNPIVSGIEEWMSQHVAFARAIASPELAPTNLEFKGVTAWKTTLLTSASDATADNAKLVNVGIVTYRNRSGLNPVIWGHFNASYPQDNVLLKNFDRIHIIRIRNMALDAVDRVLANLIGRPLGMAISAAIAAIESLGSQALAEVQGIESAQLIYLESESNLAENKLAFRIEIRAANVLDLIVANFVFIAGV